VATLVYAASELEKIKDSLAGTKALPPVAMQELNKAEALPHLDRWWEQAQRLMKRD
jgi:hypothetical protein